MIEHMFICDLNFVDIGMAHICITFLFLLNIYVHISFLVKCIFFFLSNKLQELCSIDSVKTVFIFCIF